MNEKDVRKFAKRVNYDSPIRVYFYENKDPLVARGYAYYTKRRKYIKINKYQHNQTDLLETIFHEIGHLHVQGYSYNQIDKEFLAQCWAIERSQELKLKRIERALFETSKYWYEMRSDKEWKICYSEHIAAGKLLIKYWGL